MPVTIWPRLAKKRAFSPVPQPESNIAPVMWLRRRAIYEIDFYALLPLE